MDNQPTYEQLIAGKLISIPVPDMADAIWARIETQLDIDMPTDDGDGDPWPTAPSGPGFMSWGLSVVVVALITAFLIFKHKPKTKQTAQSPVTPTEKINQPAENSTGPPKLNVPDLKTTNPVRLQASDRDLNKPFDSIRSIPDVATQPAIPIDSIKTAGIEPPVILPSVKDSIPPPRKRRGVSGLNDNDYRIIPKKDST